MSTLDRYVQDFLALCILGAVHSKAPTAGGVIASKVA